MLNKIGVNAYALRPSINPQQNIDVEQDRGRRNYGLAYGLYGPLAGLRAAGPGPD